MDHAALKTDIDILIDLERNRQKEGINLIASENYLPKDIRAILSSEYTNKYAEGDEFQRFYSGCYYCNEVEHLAKSWLKNRFNVGYANVQPHSGSLANYAVYFSCLNVKDKVLAPDVMSGGHISYGLGSSFFSKIFNFHYYTLNDKDQFDLNILEQRLKEVRPKLLIVGYSAYSRILPFDDIAKLGKKYGCLLLADMAHYAGLIFADKYPFPKDFNFMTFTTQKTLRGPRGGVVLAEHQFAKRLDNAVFPTLQSGPHFNTILAKYACFKKTQTIEYSVYADKVISIAKKLSLELLKNKNVKILTGGTDTHLFVMDVTNFGITGQQASDRLEKNGIYVSKSLIPFDPNTNYDCSAIRIGSPCLANRLYTACGNKQTEFCSKFAKIICDILQRDTNRKADVDKLILNYFEKEMP